MARPLRVQFPGAVYHVTARGNSGQRIFLDPYDHSMFLDTLAEAIERYDWICHAYCLMPNHYHLLLETREATLSRGMRHVNGVYTQRVNRRHQRYGHLFQGRYKAILVEKEQHLLELARYIALNPVRARLAACPSQWPWSSFGPTAGLTRAPDWLTTDWLLGQFDGRREIAQHAYRQFVTQAEPEAPWNKLRGQIYLGSDAFIESVPVPRGELDEVPHAQRRPAPPLHVLLGDNPDDAALARAYREHRFTLKQIADYLGVHYSTVSRRIQRHEQS